MRCYLFKSRRRGRDGKVRVGKFWRLRYQFDGEEKEREKCLGVADKQVAERLKTELVRELEREQHGIIPPRALRDGAVKPLADHLADFVDDLAGRGRDRMYVYNVGKRVERLLDECEWILPKDVTGDSFRSWRNRNGGKAPKTLNDYLDAMNALLNWMQRQGRLLANPLLDVGKVQTRGREERRRRALSEAECERLLSVAGPHRVAYLLALVYGLRRAELEGLQWGDVHLDALRPFMSVRASTTKNHENAVRLLRDDVAEALRSIQPEGVSAAASVLGNRLPTMKQHLACLAAAGIAEYDAQGRRADFHALRHTCITLGQRAGVAPRDLMEWARHSDMRLTNVTYTDAGLLDMGNVLDRLPRFASPERKESRAVVNGSPVNTENDTENDTVRLVRAGPSKSDDVNVISDDGASQVLTSEAFGASESAEVMSCHEGEESWGTRIRT